VTTARIAPARRPAVRAGSAALCLWPAIPLLVMLRPMTAMAPGLQAYGARVLGLGATTCLLAVLAVTPLAAATGLRQPGQWRRRYGLWMAVLGGTGLDLALAGGTAAGHLREWTGTLIVVLLIPLAATANTAAQKALGTYWKKWQKPLTWAVWAVTGLHLAVLPAPAAGAGFALASAPLLAARVPAVRQRIARRGSQGGWPRTVLRAGLAAGFAAGMTILTVLEIRACGNALRLVRP
jgi:DMSO/TMAO reductase YedYZ heme-binding membrane subunit